MVPNLRTILKKILSLGIVAATIFFLNACVTRTQPVHSMELSNENWQLSLDTNPAKWLHGADSWFIKGEPTPVETANLSVAPNAVMSTMHVRTGDFTKILVQGGFQVQIFGTDGPNTINVLGPAAAVRAVSVEMINGVLCIRQFGQLNPQLMAHVIVRIGVKCLEELTQMGCGTIEAVQIRTKALTIKSTFTASGNIYVGGHCLNVRRITKLGTGSVIVFGAQTPVLDITASGLGTVNVSGTVGVRSIVHHGAADVNIIGANSDCLKVYADGRGKIGVSGIVKLRSVVAKGQVCVFICSVLTDHLRVFICDRARVGLAGKARVLYLNAVQSTRFYGRALCTWDAFVHATDVAHVNVSATDKLFAYANNNATIYAFGPADSFSQFTTGDAVILTFNESPPCIMGPFKDELCYIKKPKKRKFRPRMRPGEG